MRVFLLLCLLIAIEGKRQRADKRLEAQRTIPAVSKNDPYKASNVDAVEPVIFTKLGKEGVMDPRLGLRQPVDFLEMSLKFPRSPEEEYRMLQNADPNKILRLPKGKDYVAKRDRPQSVREYNPDVEEEHHEDIEKGNITIPMPFDFETIQAVNSALPHIYRANIAKTQGLYKSGSSKEETNDTKALSANNFFPLQSFDLKVDRKTANWTTCEEFSRKAYFHPKEVAGVAWYPFFIWSAEYNPNPMTFKFSYPTKQLVNDYRTEYGPHLNRTVDWKQPMLLLKAWMEMLLIAGDRRGLFYAIPKLDIPETEKNKTFELPTVTIRLKIVDQYLGMMFCEEQIGLILAVEGQEPDFKDMPAEAEKLWFRGNGVPVLKELVEAEPPEDEGESLRKPSNDNSESPMMPLPRSKSPFFNDDF